MALETGAGAFMTANTYTAAQTRRAVFFPFARTSANTPGLLSGGLASATDMQLSAAGSGLVVYVSTGECLIPGTESTSQGGYYAWNSSQSSVTLATANATNPRVDLICATADDGAYTAPSGGTSNTVSIQAVTGTPTSGATLSNLSGAPTLPGSSLLLGYVLVPATATNLTSANIANKASQIQLQPVIPGQLLGAISYGDGANSNYTANTSALTALDTTNLRLPITVPPNGRVRFYVDARVQLGTNQGGGQLGFLNGSTTLSSGYVLDTVNLTNGDTFRVAFQPLVTNLTPGPMNVDLAAYAPGVTFFIDYGPIGAGNTGPINFAATAA